MFPTSGTGLPFVIACSVKLTVILSCAAVLMLVLRRQSAALRHCVWASALLSALFLPALMLLIPAWHSTSLSSAAAALTSPRAVHPAAMAPTLPPLAVNASPSHTRVTSFSLLLLWFSGALVVLSRVLTGFARLYWLKARSQRLIANDWIRETLQMADARGVFRSIRLLEAVSPSTMPLTYGFLRPVILVPAGATQWSECRRRVVLSHEIAHIARYDWILQICAELACVLYWFHPLVWLAASRLRHESERACDDVVLSGGVLPSQYASQLLDLTRTLKSPDRAWSTALAIARPTNLERRFAAMLKPFVNRSHLSPRTKVLIPCLTLMLLLPLAALRVSSQDQAGTTSGRIQDPSGAAIPNATVVMSNHDANTIDMTTTDSEGKFAFNGLVPGKYDLQVYKPGFETYRQANVSLDGGRDFDANLTLQIGSITEQVKVVPEGLAKPAVTEKSNGKPSRLGIGGDVQTAKLLNRVQPVYPEAAKTAGIQGTVVLHAVIGMDGRPLSLRVMNSRIDPELARSAVEAVSRWRYQPTLLNGEPIEIETTIQVSYTLAP
ncbi:MAG TPA: M56 family metallopeptidase [Candidatus Acidoferrales bacterium]|nr:M56 family metallopeptidase [Candidatus Acidoferrales bacterium]